MSALHEDALTSAQLTVNMYPLLFNGLLYSTFALGLNHGFPYLHDGLERVVAFSTGDGEADDCGSEARRWEAITRKTFDL